MLAPDIEMLDRGLQRARFVWRLDRSDQGSGRRRVHSNPVLNNQWPVQCAGVPR
jgi:hypothetical protein